MKKLIALLLLAAAAAAYAHYRHWIDLPVAQLPRQQIAENAARPSFPRFGFGRRPQGQRAAQTIPVIAARATRADVPVTADAVGTIQALNTVVVRAQVDGQLIEVAFREGQDVKAGDVLARIDPRTYQAQYDQAVAKKAQDSAQLANARLDYERYDRLARSNSGSKQQADTQRAVVAQLEAQLRVDQALIDAAKTTLDHTTIRAPISGRTGIRQVDAGNNVRSGDANGIVTITQIKPVSLVFNLPQQQLLALRSAVDKGAVEVQALEADNKTVLDRGLISVIDNQVDPATGTVKIKAQFANGDLRLWPGQFVNVRVFVTKMPDVLTVPSVAVQRGPAGPFVYVVGDGKVKLTNIKPRLQNETLAVIESGLKEGDIVVTTGFGRLNDGAAVSVTMQDEIKPAPAAGEEDNSGARRRRRRG